MILSRRWLSRHLPSLPDGDALVQGLEQVGIEVAEVRSYGEDFAGVELVEVVARSPHPDSDHLSLVDVRRGSKPVTRIVTGAGNGFPGQRLWYAPPATTLPDGRTLGVRDLRGIASPGMLLSAAELGYRLGPDQGLWVWEGPQAIGATFLEAMGGADTLYELELTPNIAQYLQSVRRIAAELAAVWKMPPPPAIPFFAYGSAPLAEVELPDRCHLYGVVKFSLKPGAVSPLWMQTLLRAVGHRIIHPAVDITNFILWDLGQPLHAFDARRLQGAIRVRGAQNGEELTLLDGQVLPLMPEDLVIADQEKPLALAGIMGGENSGIAEDTLDVVLECAHFESAGIFSSSKKHNLITDAAAHFGRGTDPEAVLQAPYQVLQILRQADLLANTEAGSLVGVLPAEKRVEVNPGQIRKILGVDWSDGQIEEALTAFGYRLVDGSALVPRYRHDVETTHDLAEDAAKYFGLDAIPRTMPHHRQQLAGRSTRVVVEEEVRDLVASAGYYEVLTRTFSNEDLDARYPFGKVGDPVAVMNPLRDEESRMRRYLLPSLLQVVRYNRARHDLPLRLFEVGSVFSRHGSVIDEAREMAVVLSLDVVSAWPGREQPSIYDLTGLWDGLCRRLGWDAPRQAFDTVPSFLHPGRAQRIMSGGRAIGYVGELRPGICAEYRAKRLGVLVVRLPRELGTGGAHPGRPSRFPEVQRDLSVVVPQSMPYQQLLNAIEGLTLPDLRMVRPIDRFEGDFGTSLTLRCTFQSDTETLTDERIDEEVGEILTTFRQMGVELRQ